jgi:hypothetical protein
MQDRIRPTAVAALLVIGLAAVPAAAQEPTRADVAPPFAPQAILSPQAVELLEAAIAGTGQNQVTLSSRPYFFPSLQGGTLTMIGFEASKRGLMFGATDTAGVGADGMPNEAASLELFGSIMQDGQEVRRLGAIFDLRRDLGTEDQSSLHSFGDTLQPGSYELVWGVVDTISGLAGTRRDSLDVPAFGAELTTSTVLLARGFGGAQGVFGPNTVYPGVRVLTATFDDDLDRVIDPAETPEVSLTYIVIGAQLDPATQGFNLEMGYRILDNETDQSISRWPNQTSTRTTVAQPIPLSTVSGLEAGKTYRFEITVRDLAANTETVVEVPFEVAG